MSVDFPSPLARHVKETSGHFSPFTYSIGVASEPDSGFADLTFPLEWPASPRTEERLTELLTYQHEGVHFLQFIGSAFGLRTLRRTSIALRYLHESRPLEFPVLTHARTGLTEHQRRTWARLIAFLDSMDQ